MTLQDQIDKLKSDLAALEARAKDCNRTDDPLVDHEGQYLTPPKRETWCWMSSSYPFPMVWCDDKDGRAELAFGLLFVSEEARDAANAKLEVEQKLRLFAARNNPPGWKPDWRYKNQLKWRISYRHDQNKWGA